MTRVLDFGLFYTPCITDSDCDKTPEELYDISEIRDNFHTLHIFRTYEKQLFVCLQTKKKFSKKTLQTILFSHYSNIDFFSTHNNCCPSYFVKAFTNEEEFGCCKILSMHNLFKSVQNCYEILKDKDVMQPELNFFRYKLECLILCTLNQKSNRNPAIMGQKTISSRSTVCIKEI